VLFYDAVYRRYSGGGAGLAMEPEGGILHRSEVMAVLGAALEAVDPYGAVLKALREHPDALAALGSVRPGGRVYVVGAGKAGAAMAKATEDALGERIAEGLVIVKDGHASTGRGGLAFIETQEASHPVPDARGAEGTRRVLEIAGRAGEGDLVICLISGGGSALLTAPADGITLEDVQSLTAQLLRAGANIRELNTVRKHLSVVSGGQMARAASPARVLSLILSDVTGSPLDVIASGPTVPDPTTFNDAREVLELYGIEGREPAAVRERLAAGMDGRILETPKPGDPIFDRVTNIPVAGNVVAVEAAARKAQENGLGAVIVSTYVEGEARDVGTVLASIAREVALHRRPWSPPVCLLFGGETTVTVKGSGVGGRNTELALSAALALDGLGPGVVLASLATDGGDGASPSAGAIVDGTTAERARAQGCDIRQYLAANDSYTLLAKLGDAIMTGPTGTNVNDVMAVFVFSA
jgi:glycerate 2-kinase